MGFQTNLTPSRKDAEQSHLIQIYRRIIPLAAICAKLLLRYPTSANPNDEFFAHQDYLKWSYWSQRLIPQSWESAPSPQLRVHEEIERTDV